MLFVRVGNALCRVAGGIPGGGSVDETNQMGRLEEQIDAWTWRESGYEYANITQAKLAGD